MVEETALLLAVPLIDDPPAIISKPLVSLTVSLPHAVPTAAPQPSSLVSSSPSLRGAVSSAATSLPQLQRQ